MPDLITPPEPIDIDTVIGIIELPPSIFIMGNGGESQRLDYPLVVCVGDVRLIDIERQGIFFMGFVRYTDIFGNRYISGFCFLFSHEDNRFVLAGGSAYNYRRREDGSTQHAPDQPTPT
jgi:hypothetical protein